MSPKETSAAALVHPGMDRQAPRSEVSSQKRGNRLACRVFSLAQLEFHGSSPHGHGNQHLSALLSWMGCILLLVTLVRCHEDPGVTLSPTSIHVTVTGEDDAHHESADFPYWSWTMNKKVSKEGSSTDQRPALRIGALLSLTPENVACEEQLAEFHRVLSGARSADYRMRRRRAAAGDVSRALASYYKCATQQVADDLRLLHWAALEQIEAFRFAIPLMARKYLPQVRAGFVMLHFILYCRWLLIFKVMQQL